MSRVIRILGGRLYEATRRSARREGTSRSRTPLMRPQPPRLISAGASSGGVRVGKITSVIGTSRAATYGVQLEDGSTRSGVKPRIRGQGAGTEFDINPAAVGTPCLYSIEDVGGVPTVVIHRCEETIQSTACAQQLGVGTANSGVTATERSNTPFKPRTKLNFSTTFSVTFTRSSRLSFLLYSFPLGAIDIRSIVADLLISAPSVTNSIDVGMGTAAASGSGNGLTGTQVDIVPSTNPGSISSGGLAYQRLFPTTGESRPVLFDGTSTAIAIYLNIALHSLTWNATDVITAAGNIFMNWNGAGEYA